MAQVCEGYTCAMSAEMAVWLRNYPRLYSYLRGQDSCLLLSSESLRRDVT